MVVFPAVLVHCSLGALFAHISHLGERSFVVAWDSLLESEFTSVSIILFFNMVKLILITACVYSGWYLFGVLALTLSLGRVLSTILVGKERACIVSICRLPSQSFFRVYKLDGFTF